MAERKLLFFGDEGFSAEIEVGDTTTFGGLTIESAGNIAVSGGGELTGLPSTPSGDTAATSKAYVDGLIVGLGWKDPVVCLRYMGNATVATINGLSPSAGQAYVVTDAGTLTAGSLAVVAGDFVEYDGSAWVKIVDASGGYVPAGTRAILSGDDTLVSPYTDGTDNDKIVVFSGSSNTATDTGDTVEKAAVLIDDPNANGYYDNLGYVYDGTVPTGSWIQFTGLGQITAGDGLYKSGRTIHIGAGDGIAAAADEIAVDLATNPGLQFTSNKLDLLLKSADELAKDASGLYVVGVPSLFKIGGTAVGATVTAANLDTLTDGSDASSLHTHATAGEANRIENTYTVGTGGVTAGDPVYFSADDTVAEASASASSAWGVFGVAKTTEVATASVEVLSEGPIGGVISGATAGDLVYLAAGGGLTTTRPTAANNRLVLIGYAINDTDLYVHTQILGQLR